MSNGIEKNLDVVRGQVNDYVVEVAVITQRVRNAVRDRQFFKIFHIVTGYLEEALDKMPRLWFYTWLPKWLLVAYLVFR